jgi:hypothetical protein
MSGAAQHRGQPRIEIQPTCGQRHIDAQGRRHPQRHSAPRRRAAEIDIEFVRRDQASGNGDPSIGAERDRGRGQ